MENKCNYIPISVIASFNTAGEFIPIWFRFEDCVYDVAVDRQNEDFGFKYFECEIMKCSDPDKAEYSIGKKITLLFAKHNYIWGIRKD